MQIINSSKEEEAIKAIHSITIQAIKAIQEITGEEEIDSPSISNFKSQNVEEYNSPSDMMDRYANTTNTSSTSNSKSTNHSNLTANFNNPAPRISDIERPPLVDNNLHNLDL